MEDTIIHGTRLSAAPLMVVGTGSGTLVVRMRSGTLVVRMGSGTLAARLWSVIPVVVIGFGTLRDGFWENVGRVKV